LAAAKRRWPGSLAEAVIAVNLDTGAAKPQERDHPVSASQSISLD
jgi:hypothetical protein